MSCQSEIAAERARLREGHGSPHLLDHAAQAYFGTAVDQADESPNETDKSACGKPFGSGRGPPHRTAGRAWPGRPPLSFGRC